MEKLSPILRLATENSNTPTELVDEKEAARRLHVLASTMSHWRKQRRAGKQAPVVKLIQFGKLFTIELKILITFYRSRLMNKLSIFSKTTKDGCNEEFFRLILI